MHFSGSPTPPAPAARDTHALLPAAPRPTRAFAERYPYALYRQPPPRPRLRRSSPAPPWGGGSAYDIRWAAVHRSMVTTATGGCHGARAPRRRVAGIAAGALRKGLIGIAGDLMPSPPEP